MPDARGKEKSQHHHHMNTAVTVYKQLLLHSMTMFPDYHHLVIAQTNIQRMHLRLQIHVMPKDSFAVL